MPHPLEDFLRTTLKSHLLTRDQLMDALQTVPRERRQTPQDFADHLVRNGKLSRFQARKLVSGVSLGLMLGQYQVLAPIGRGGMGAVYLALDMRLNRHVALKVLPPQRAKGEGRHRARFQREMETSQRVAHPHIAQTIQAGVSGGVHYIAMEFIPGMSLYKLVHTEGPLTVTRAARLFAEVAAALDHAHNQGLIHRDLKPSNIMVTPNDHAKLLDLGLALREGEEVDDVEVIGGKGYLVGSVDYMAPEQTRDAAAVDGRADLYGLGCTLYFALSGRPPFSGVGNLDRIRAQRVQTAEPLSKLNPKVPEKFAAFVARLMAKKPQDRPANAAQARAELLAWAEQDGARPLDAPAEVNMKETLAVLDAEEPSAQEEARDAVLLITEPAPESSSFELPADFFADEGQDRRDLIWIIAGLVGFWVFVGLVLLIVVLWRW